MKNPNVILITGASSGIGAALAEHYAERGVKLLLTGRNMPRLMDIEKLCRAKGAAVKLAALDITDAAAMSAQVLSWYDQEPIDLVIANAGVSGGGLIPRADHQTRFDEVITINVNGTLNTILPLIGRMQLRGKGQIALMSSLAGFRGLPTAAAYSTSKVAIRALGESLRPLLARDGIAVNVIHPGFVETPLTSVNGFYMPLLMRPDRAAQRIREGLAANKARICFPWPMAAVARLIAALPNRWIDGLLARAPRKD